MVGLVSHFYHFFIATKMSHKTQLQNLVAKINKPLLLLLILWFSWALLILARLGLSQLDLLTEDHVVAWFKAGYLRMASFPCLTIDC